MARAIVYTEIGSPDVLHLVDIPDPVAGPGEVVVRIEAAGVNPLDAKLRAGKRPSPPIIEPRRVGFDGAGVIDSIGEGVTGFAVATGSPLAVPWARTRRISPSQPTS
ncbi:alcohol dehydrogenase catalytic domain-containing protein [Microbacterium sp. CH12i]|uniref:alcohol dehydrogenase catalytic domain-containing protein n=1 Tax=Microbacterium sp. CH12i TaxID=1479651 RepID=UPI00055CD90A|nr:alcohol dehydrogenase catalytic domain-containing protein [Microbacterium sp. CH12i]